MSNSKHHTVIVIDDSDQEDCPRRRKPEPMSRFAPPTDTQTRLRSAKNKTYEIIEIDSDEHSDKPPPSKRAKTDLRTLTPPPVESDGNRAPKVVHGSAVESGHVPLLSGLTMRKDFIWTTARRIFQKYDNPTGFSLKRDQYRLRVNPIIALALSPVTDSFSLAGGAINKIIQKPGCIVVSSATLGGQPNDPEAAVQPQDAYNREGTLQIQRDDTLKGQIILHGHCNIEAPELSTSSEQSCLKCYTVNDISFDPNQNHLMASTGNNGCVQLWEGCEKVDNGYYKYPRAPHDVLYRERDSLMAVTCMNGCVYVHSTRSQLPLGDPVELRVVPLEVQHSVGAIVWGRGASADALFASSEAQSMTDHSGYHVALDPDQGRVVYGFSAKESGDAMALDADGERLALCTAAPDGAHLLRLYDIGRKNGQHPLQSIQLDPFYVEPDSLQLEPREGEVRAVSFSPDGLLLALSRSDDELHIYDSRFMGRNRAPMSRFLHWGDDCCLTGDSWGIVDAVWVDGWCGKGLGVVTGGSDGCVRFWDVRRSADDISNGEVLAQPNSDIGHFSVGDPYSGEKPLVVGDNGGRVYVYDHATAGSSTR